MSRVRVSSSAPPAARPRARRSAHRRCREFESRHPLHPVSRQALRAFPNQRPYAGDVTEFAGFPVAALDFYDDLEVDNTKSYWEKHKATYDNDVKAPMVALVSALAPEFALDRQTYKVFRPYRDVRFAKDKTPYKTNQGAYVAVAPSTGWYVEISARGVRTGGGCYDMSGAAPRGVPRRRRRRQDRRPADPHHQQADQGRLGARRRAAQDGAARVRRRAPPHRPAAPQVAPRRQVLRLRQGHPHAARCSTRCAPTGGPCVR